MERMPATLLAALARFNDAHPWSHNDAYARWVLRQARAVRRAGGTSALDVGCGTGNLIERLATVMPEVVGIEPDAQIASLARVHLASRANAEVRTASFGDAVRARGQYDLVTFVAVLHHLPLATALEQARSLLRPGGRLVIVGLARETRDDVLWSLTSMLLNPVIGLARHPRRSTAVLEHLSAPTAEARESFDQIAAAAMEVLPGIRMRRGLFWRYTAVWVAPRQRPSRPGSQTR